MGWVEMSERELRRAEVLASVFAGRGDRREQAACRGFGPRCGTAEAIRRAVITKRPAPKRAVGPGHVQNRIDQLARSGNCREI